MIQPLQLLELTCFQALDIAVNRFDKSKPQPDLPPILAHPFPSAHHATFKRPNAFLLFSPVTRPSSSEVSTAEYEKAQLNVHKGKATGMDWQELNGNWVLLPNRPVALIHFLGGAFVATAPQLTYRRLLECLADQGYAIVATPFVNTFDHRAIAESVHRRFERTLYTLQAQYLRRRYLPIYGMGHSMGCKLHLLIGCLFEVERAGNILISFNNFSAREAVPLADQFATFFEPLAASGMAMEFSPSPQETKRLVIQNYGVRRNLLIKFSNDTIDQTRDLNRLLQDRFAEMVTAQTLTGNHLTPLGPDVKWQAGAVFTPFDAIAQWMRQEVYRELAQLERAILRWLNPLGGAVPPVRN